MTLFFFSSGMFLGWSLGANDAANIFGTAVGSRMLRFRTAAIIGSVFVVIGAVVGGSGTADTLGRLGAVNALAGSFTVALAAGVTVFWMTRLSLPVSTSQAIVGAIIGWNLFSGSPTDGGTLGRIVSTWVLCPILAGFLAAGLYLGLRFVLTRAHVHLLQIDWWTRAGLVLVGAFGAYSLGANNIANVVGVFVPAQPFGDLELFGLITVSGTQIVFFLGGLAIAVGIFTYSKKVMDTVGTSLMRISPEAALVVVLAQALVLFVFASEGLRQWLIARGLPAVPLVPVSSSQAVVGAVIGIALIRGARELDWKMLGGIALGWVATPVIAALISLTALFIVQNVFDQVVCRPTLVQTASAEVVEGL
ncbi:MAG: inorganic phosphate transporter [Acidobacteria bacterium]|nr:MAG: inorganic phosphate transporter [Acidobacteriota bacterium]